MTDYQMFAAFTSLAIIGIVTLIATKEWLRTGGRAATIVYSLGGILAVALLWTADVPPDWFDGEGEGYWTAVTLLLWAFVLSTPAERGFGRPLLLGMSLTLIAFNLYAWIASHL